MPHISVDSPILSLKQKKALIKALRQTFAEIADIEEENISVTVHELPTENMTFDEIYIEDDENNDDNNYKSSKEKNKTGRKKSFFREIFPG